MKRIETVGIVGMGALGLLYADLITRGLGDGHVFFIADRDRRKRYAETRLVVSGAGFPKSLFAVVEGVLVVGGIKRGLP